MVSVEFTLPMNSTQVGTLMVGRVGNRVARLGTGDLGWETPAL